MTVPLAAGSPRTVAANRFALELRRAMAAKGASVKRLAEAAHVGPSAINSWRSAGNLPRPETAARLAEVLDAPRLLQIATEGRSRRCQRCARPFVDLAGGQRRYCSNECREIDAQLRAPAAGSVLHAAVRTAVDARLDGAPERETLPVLIEALHEYTAADAKRVVRVDRGQRRLAGYAAAVDAMCAGCEPEGLCQTAECPLRAFSPLPLAPRRSTAALREPEGAWGPSHREEQLVAIQQANKERWSRPGERDRMAQASRSRHAALTPEQREALGARISAGRRHVAGATT